LQSETAVSLNGNAESSTKQFLPASTAVSLNGNTESTSMHFTAWWPAQQFL
jgi:hypothetical protein